MRSKSGKTGSVLKKSGAFMKSHCQRNAEGQHAFSYQVALFFMRICTQGHV